MDTTSSPVGLTSFTIARIKHRDQGAEDIVPSRQAGPCGMHRTRYDSRPAKARRACGASSLRTIPTEKVRASMVCHLPQRARYVFSGFLLATILPAAAILADQPASAEALWKKLE